MSREQFLTERLAERSTENERLRAVLAKYADDYCEGWCKDMAGGEFKDCGGCAARLALKE